MLVATLTVHYVGKTCVVYSFGAISDLLFEPSTPTGGMLGSSEGACRVCKLALHKVCVFLCSIISQRIKSIFTHHGEGKSSNRTKKMKRDQKMVLRGPFARKSRKGCLVNGGGVGAHGQFTQGTNFHNPRTTYKRSKNVFAVRCIALILAHNITELLQLSPLSLTRANFTGNVHLQ